MRVRCAITMGDPSGIGPEVIAKTLGLPRIRGLADFTVIGDKWVMEKYESKKVRKYESREVKFIDLQNVPKKGFAFGKVRAEYGRAALEYLDQAIALIKEGKIDCLVTAPVHKEAISLAGGPFSGHTGYLGRVAIFEVMPITDRISKLILEKVAAADIQEAAMEEGMLTMKQDGYVKVLEGVTTIEEVIRVAQY